MSYKVAIASSDGKTVNESFGAASSFYIYEILDVDQIHLLEIRRWQRNKTNELMQEEEVNCQRQCTSEGCDASVKRCNGEHIPKLQLIEDCRCLLCKNIGFQVSKQLDKKAIIGFALEYDINEALEKIAFYLERVDHHQTLRGFAKQQKASFNNGMNEEIK